MRVEKSQSIVPPHRDIAILLDKKTILLEDGTEWPYEKTPVGTKVFALKKTIDDIWNKQKLGEVLKYDGTIIKWRMKCPARFKSKISWPNDSLEVNVINSRGVPAKIEWLLEGYVNWRDWVEEYGGNIIGTMSSTSWSLFKASLQEDTWETPYKGVPGIEFPIGGRLLPCKSLRSTFSGDYIQWDLYSAYTKRLSSLAFGGIGSSWREVRTTTNFDRLVEKGYCVYIEARVKFPRERKYNLGPLPIRRTEYHPRPTSNIQYPSEGIIEGIWTYEEIRDADRFGANITFRRAFVHFPTGRKYFHEDWYRIIQEGRTNLPGFARGLVKQTGNALWGRYAMRIRPSKTVWRDSDGKRRWIVHPVKTIKRSQCMELADQLCGKIRSNLFGFAISANDCLIQGNTDGAWVSNEREWRPPSDDWRIKRRAIKLDVLDDATYRYWEDGKEKPTYVVPGVATDFTESYFNRQWNKYASN